MFTNPPTVLGRPQSPDEISHDTTADGTHWDDCPMCSRSLMNCSDTVIQSASGIEPTQEKEELPWADRRLYDRFPARSGTRVEIRRWGILSGPSFAKELLDISEVGVRVRLSIAARQGEQLDVTLWVPGGTWCVRSMGIVRWSVIGTDGLSLTGIQLRRRLMPQDFKRLADSGFPVYRPTLGEGKTPG
jgi:hypothetical protein